MKKGKEPAYPVIGAPGAPSDYSGMTKRELFAAMAMQGMAMRVKNLYDHDVAEHSVRLADALLAQLLKEPT